jgi:hypothetical protein
MMPRIRRRDFLILGSGGAAYALTTGAGSLASPGEDRELLAPLSVGYWSGEEAVAAVREPEPAAAAGALEPTAASGDPEAFRADVLAAARLRSGDSQFLRAGARITVHGVVEAGGSWPRPELDAVSVFAYHQIPGHEPIRQCVWDLGKAPVANQAAPVSFTMPVSAGGLRLGVQRHDGRPGAMGRYVSGRLYGVQAPRASQRSSQQELMLRVGRGPDGHALRRGVYFVAGLAHGSASPGSWSGVQFRATEDGADVEHRRLMRRSLDGPQPVDFDYLVISVEPA